MATDEVQDAVMEDALPRDSNQEQTEHEDEDEDGSASSESDIEPVLAVTRQRRANAGNRMSKLLELAGQEDAQQEEEYGEIFKEAADDVEFEAQDDEEGDVNMDSSSEDEDAEGGAQDDEEAGEKELKKQERSENKKKRKRESLLQDAMKRAAARIGPKVAPPRTIAVASSPTSEAGPSRPRKKSERVSWLPDAGDGAVRASSRQLAVQNKTAVHERLKEKEQHRLRTVAIMKAAERRKEADRPKILTQEERLEEAARVERMNSRSLNRWEAAEKKRVEEQKARLAALKNHRLEGPIITYYSGPALWINDKLKAVGKQALVQEVQGRPTSAGSQEDADDDAPAPAVQPVASNSSTSPDRPLDVSSNTPRTPLVSAAAHTHPIPQPPALHPPSEESPTGRFLQGIEEYANSNTEAQPAQGSPQQQQSSTSHQGSHPPSAHPTLSQQHFDTVPYETPSTHGFSQPPPESGQPDHTEDTLLAKFQTTFSSTPKQEEQKPASPPSPQPKLPPRREIASRTLVILRDFPEENLGSHKREPDFIRHHLLDWPLTVAQTKKEHKATTVAASKKAICAVTGQPARYCDPATGLYYIDAVALKGMRWVVNSKGKWNELTGTFAYSEKTRPARGVPDMFLMHGDELAKRKEEVKVLHAEQDKARAEARAKAQAEAQARAQAQAQSQAHAQAQAQNYGPRVGPVTGGQQIVYRAQTTPQVQVPVQPQSQPRPPAPGPQAPHQTARP